MPPVLHSACPVSDLMSEKRNDQTWMLSWTRILKKKSIAGHSVKGWHRGLIISALRGEKQGDREFKVVLGCITVPRPAWAT